jgi:hypothetical protein
MNCLYCDTELGEHRVGAGICLNCATASELRKLFDERESTIATLSAKVAELEADIKVKGLSQGYRALQDQLDTLKRESTELKSQRDSVDKTRQKLEGVLIRCTEQLESWPLASGCNGIMCVDQHLEIIMDQLTKAEAVARVLAEWLKIERASYGPPTDHPGVEGLIKEAKKKATEERG